MAGQNNRELRIHLLVCDEKLEVTLHDRAEEEHYRKAAKVATKYYAMYSQRYKGFKSDHSIVLMTLLDFALRYIKERERNDTSPYVDILNTLTAEIEDALGERK